MPGFNLVAFRIAVASMAGLVAACMIWLLAAEVIRPDLGYFPVNAQDAEVFSGAARQTRWAAAIGLVRGDIWSEAAIADVSHWLFQSGNTSQVGPSDIEDAETIAKRAASLSPHDARVWIILAGLQFRSGQTSNLGTQDLKLSYYTGPNEFALAPLRLLVAARASWDDELKDMIKSEILRIIFERPDLKSAVAAAFRAATPGVRQFLEAILNEADPVFLASIKGQPQRN